MRLRARKTEIASAGPAGVVRTFMRPVTIATAMITAKMASIGAGSTRTKAKVRKPNATAVS